MIDVIKNVECYYLSVGDLDETAYLITDLITD